ncbi:MAG: phage GP46 family protein [Desulfobulbaceae bacterium]|nr:phage GP46 family protein [Desulfobulbaceae bacterium]
MDFAIVMGDDGLPQMTYDRAATIFNNIVLSWTIRRGSLFVRPLFGNRFHLLKKNTARTEALAEEYGKEALQWLLDTGKAIAIRVTAQRDANDRNRLNMRAEVTQADGLVVTFDHFVRIV